MNGFLVIDKPAGMTSRSVVNRAQQWFARGTKIGHAGTLDPLATGVLVLCVGAATKLVERVQAMGKTYRTRVLLGFTSTTDDADGTLTPSPAGEVPTEAQIRDLLTRFVGEIQQVPPAVSALKIDGQRAYDLARRGAEVKMVARPVRVDAVHLLGYEWPHLDLEIDCGKGTYIRSIARDVGEALKCGGLVQTLQRTRTGVFRVENALPLDVNFQKAQSALLPLSVID
ncbi:tRNA pseudouridine(55) synthase TruB [Limnoglobus roseus]|uniref:tRNA pseudouridine synthase B n=1 Tax=Limnoglobus roseus TaxID=2598579 RepID=A0A5C1AMJ8_9BACT|nr:tRNA pseudouridine(55) synthase TruB [Limnoglobus roseus]QEL18128.1 tRNA pseudouridine(55) synthase TruB [Limnoglobus roseus]